MERLSVKTIEYRDFSAGLHGRADEQKGFIKAQIELTYACNLHCVHCYTDPLNRPDLLKKEMPLQEILALLDKLHTEGILWICLTGGEIFMRKDFCAIYDHAHEKGFLITLFTNGTMINEEIVNHLSRKPPFCIEVSFHGAKAETFDKITKVKGSFEKCVKGIRLLLDAGLPVKLKTKAMTLNRDELGEIKEFVEALGLQFSVNGVIYPRLDGDTSSCEYRLNPDEILKLESSNPGEDEDESENCPESGTLPIRTNVYRCGCGKLHSHIDPYGQVGACTWSRKGRFHFKEKSVQEGMKELACMLHAEEYDGNSPCRDCPAMSHCEKQPEMARYESGDIQNPVEHFCELAFGRLDQTPKTVVNPHQEEKLK